MKRSFERLASTVLAGVMAFGMAIPAFAADDTQKADITMDGKGGAFAAYRLLDLSTSLRSDHEDSGEDHAHNADCYNYAYTLNAAYASTLRTALKLSDSAGQDEIIAAIEAMAETPAEVRAFANAVFAAVKAAGIEADEVASNKVFANVDQGYYLIVETATAEDPDAISLVMLDTAGQDDISVTLKDDVPTLTKKVKDTDDTKGETSDWQDAGDFDIGDDVAFQLNGTLPANLASFNDYIYIFHDRLGSGLKFNAASVRVLVDGKELGTGEYDVREYDERMRIGNDCDCTFHVEILDVMGLLADGRLSPESVITVEYTATLTEDAATGVPGNENAAYLEFSRDPYNGGVGTSKTPEDNVIGFTYKLEVDKVDGSGNPLAGAEFELQKEINGAYVAYKSLEVSAGRTEFDFVGLDAGKYKLVETKVPSGYNKADDIEFEVVADYDKNGDKPELRSLSVVRNGETVSGDAGSGAEFEIALSDGSIVTAVVNSTGVHLPTTGGAGAYLVYGAGVLAVAGGAGLVVFNKKRKSDSDTQR